MELTDIATVASWVTREGLRGASEAELLSGFCSACRELGLPIDGSLVLMDTLHPVHEGRAFRWDSKEGLVTEFEYGPTGEEGASFESWQNSAFYHLWSTEQKVLRRRLAFGDPIDFHRLEEMVADGHTDFVAMAHRFAKAGTIGEMNCFFSHFTTRDGAGFSDHDLAILGKLAPVLGLAIKCIALDRIARTIAETYLGGDAARHVLEGKIVRGRSERISAVLWFSDLVGYTKISDSAEPEDIIPMLNAYSDVVISAVHSAGGDVLKLIGDGILAIFKESDSQTAAIAALDAEADLRVNLYRLNAERKAQGRPVTDVYLGLHIGDVFYGNIGSQARLDFTVIGPAVNEVSRISSLCRSVDFNVLMSSDFAAAVPEERRHSFSCIGRYALRGVKRSQELYTLSRADDLPSADPGL